MKAALPALLVLMTALAGCSDGVDPLLTPERQQAYAFQGYTWTPMGALASDATTANVTVLDAHPLLDPAVAPFFVEQLVPHAGAEPNIGITSSGAIFVSTFDTVHRSTDNGRTWEKVREFQLPSSPVMADGWSSSDPMLWVDKGTDRIYSLSMHPGILCFALSWSDDEGNTWSDRIGQDSGPEHVARPGMSCNTPYVDHPKIVTGPPRSGFPLQPVAYPNMVYVCTNKVQPETGLILGSWCHTSYDGGRTWAYETRAIEAPAQLVTAPVPDVAYACAGINGHPAVHPDGTVLVPAGNIGGAASSCHRPPTIAVSEDHGLTWEERVYDGPVDLESQSIDPDLAITPDGTAYLVFRSHDQMTYVLRSPDKFQTWEGPFRITPPDHALNVFQAITAGDDGRVAIAFLGTRQAPTPHSDPEAPRKGPSDADGGTRWDLYLATSHDAHTEAPTWVVQQVNPYEDPIQVGCVWLRGGGNPCRNLLDFIDITLDNDGRVVAAITDGCVPRNGCTADPDNANFQSQDRQAAVAVMDRGTSLFASSGVLPALGLEHPPWPEQEAQGEVPA